MSEFYCVCVWDWLKPVCVCVCVAVTMWVCGGQDGLVKAEATKSSWKWRLVSVSVVRTCRIHPLSLQKPQNATKLILWFLPLSACLDFSDLYSDILSKKPSIEISAPFLKKTVPLAWHKKKKKDKMILKMI